MAVKLGEMLVGRGLVTPQELEDALLAQRQLGGRLGSNLVELGFVTEEQLAACLSEQLGLPFAPAEAVAVLPPELVARVPKEVAAKYRVVPLRLDGRELHVGLADPHDLDRIDELSFALGCRVRPHVMTEVTLNYALERYYGIKREARFIRVPGRDMNVLEVVPEEPTVRGRPEGGRAGRPASLEELVERLAQVMTEAQVTELAGRLLALFFDEVVILEVRGGRVRGVLATGRAGFLRAVNALDVPLVDGSLLAEVVARRQIAHRRELGDASLLQICTLLGVRTQAITAVPLLDARAPAFVAVGQGTDEARLRSGFDGLKRVLGKISCALQVVALRSEIRAPAVFGGDWIG
jgi:hypothetical protein